MKYWLLPVFSFCCVHTGIEQERGRENSSFPVEEGWENRGFSRSEIAKRPGGGTLDNNVLY